jgi:hypothetical protein
VASDDANWKRRTPGVTLHVVSGMLTKHNINYQDEFTNIDSDMAPIYSLSLLLVFTRKEILTSTGSQKYCLRLPFNILQMAVIHL